MWKWTLVRAQTCILAFEQNKSVDVQTNIYCTAVTKVAMHQTRTTYCFVFFFQVVREYSTRCVMVYKFLHQVAPAYVTEM